MNGLPNKVDDMAREREMVREQAPDHYYDDTEEDNDE